MKQAMDPVAPLVTIACPLCAEAGDAPVVIRENGFTGRQCLGCGLIYVSPRPTRDDIYNLYSHDEAHIPAEFHIRGALAKRLHARHTLRLLRRYLPAGSLLEIGAGAGYFLDEARRAGYEVCGIEMCRVLAGFINQRLGIPCEETPLSPDSFGGRTFDAVYHCDVISHFYDPLEEFAKIRDKLNPHGLVVFETGNLGDVDERGLRKIKTFQYPDHLFFYSERALRALLQRTGFAWETIARYGLGPQEACERALAALRARLRPVRRHADKPAQPAAPVAEIPALPVETGGLKQALKDLQQALSYTARYPLGAWAARAGKPQTVIVVARKI